jgi:hypothetical protein
MKGKDYGPGSISAKAKERRDKLVGKSQSAKNIENRQGYEATEEGFSRGVGKKKPGKSY